MKPAETLGALDLGFEAVLNLAVMCGLFALAAWIWPDGFFDTPIAYLTLSSVLWALGALLVALFALGGVYFILVEPFVTAKRAK